MTSTAETTRSTPTVDVYVAQVVAQAPPLTDEQRAVVALLARPR